MLNGIAIYGLMNHCATQNGKTRFDHRGAATLPLDAKSIDHFSNVVWKLVGQLERGLAMIHLWFRWQVGMLATWCLVLGLVADCWMFGNSM